jgi:hypothetical protein
MASLGLLEFDGGIWVDLGPPVFGPGDLPSHHSQIPSAPGPRTIPLPSVNQGYFSGDGDGVQDEYVNFPGSGTYNGQSPLEETDILAQEVEASTSLAPAKPNNVENNNRSEVSSVFTPPGIVLYNSGLGSSRAVLLRRIRGGVTTAPRTPKGRNFVSPRSATRWGFPRRRMSTNSRPYVGVCQLLRI